MILSPPWALFVTPLMVVPSADSSPAKFHGWVFGKVKVSRRQRSETPEQALAALEKNPKWAVFLKDELLKDLEYGGPPKSRALINLNVAFQELKGEPVTTNFGLPRHASAAAPRSRAWSGTHRVTCAGQVACHGRGALRCLRRNAMMRGQRSVEAAPLSCGFPPKANDIGMSA